MKYLYTYTHTHTRISYECFFSVVFEAAVLALTSGLFETVFT